MNMTTTIGRGCDAAVDALRAEFGSVLAERIFEAEALDFLWEARVRERYLGEQIGWDLCDEDAYRQLSRVAILSVLEGSWYTGTCLVDGQGVAVELLWKRRFASRGEAEFELLRAR
ncbi:MAG: hypothetical protein E6G94_14420 [Alphaproteobacteria bacterium]|nr:MAG: hypothetical protein E6G94_14420 [Alphaproteobacteria bacterium]